jgi:hypothetical protein
MQVMERRKGNGWIDIDERNFDAGRERERTTKVPFVFTS